MAPSGKKASKPVFKTGVPFTETQWPQSSPKDQDIILGLLCLLLEPLGNHRKTHIQPSKGKKRKRKTTPSTEDDGATGTDNSTPPPPELSSHILIGLNSVTRHLSSLATSRSPSSALAIAPQSITESTITDKKVPSTPSSTSTTLPIRPLSLVILPHPNPPSSLPHAHIPTLLALSQSPSPSSPQTRLVLLPTASESKLSTALHIPRVGAIGIMEGAPGTDALVRYVREHVGLVKCEWVEEGLKGEWKGVKVGVTKERVLARTA